MRITSFYKVPRHRRFGLTPRYAKEERKERESRFSVSADGKKTKIYDGSHMKGKMQESIFRTEYGAGKMRLIRTIIMIVTACLAVAAVYLAFEMVTHIMK